MFQVTQIRTAKLRKTRKVRAFLVETAEGLMKVDTADEATCRAEAAAASMNGAAYVVEHAVNRLPVAEFENGTEVAIGATRYAN